MYSNKLLKLNYSLSVRRDSEGKICVQYEDSEIKDGYFLTTACGRGLTFEGACENYYNKISGKTLVFYGNTQRDFRVVVL